MTTADISTKVPENGAPDGRPLGRLFILSAPSGAGKTTLGNALRRHRRDLAYSISYTTRSPRHGERDGIDYHFISLGEFEKGIAQNRWAEWAKVHNNYYGSSALWINRTLKSGRHILMDIDMQGARQMLERFPLAITVFIMPPSIEELEVRLRGRGTDSPDTIELRLDNARDEISQSDLCRHVLVNDDLEEATGQLIKLVDGYLAE